MKQKLTFQTRFFENCSNVQEFAEYLRPLVYREEVGTDIDYHALCFAVDRGIFYSVADDGALEFRPLWLADATFGPSSVTQ